MQIKTNGNELIVNGKSTMVTAKNMAIFKLLLKTDGVVVMQALKDETRIFTTHTMRQHVSVLRSSLKSIGGPKIITHYKVGYELKESLTNA